MISADAAGTHARTRPVRVRAVLDGGAVVTGLAHVKPGAYQRRVSDVLNLGQVKFLAITDARYEVPGQEPVGSECVLINIDHMVMVDVTPVPEDDGTGGEPLLPDMPT